MRKQTEDLPSLGSYGKAGEDEDENDYEPQNKSTSGPGFGRAAGIEPASAIALPRAPMASLPQTTQALPKEVLG